MQIVKILSPVLTVFLFVLLLFSPCAAWSQTRGLTPESPEVKAAVQKAVQFLSGSSENRIGGQALIGLALYKSGAPKDHPKIQEAVRAIRAKIGKDGYCDFDNPNYSLGISGIFLAELDPVAYRKELICISKTIQANQRWDGGWSYMSQGRNPDEGHPTADMSMTQYAVMGSWTLQRNNIPVDSAMMNRALRFLMLAQTQNGQFGYQTKVANDFNSAQGEAYTLSMTTAGMASIYVCRDLFKLNRSGATQNVAGFGSADDSELTPEQKKAKELVIPPVFRPIEVSSEYGEITSLDSGPMKAKLNVQYLSTIQERGNNWLMKNFEVAPTGYTYYYMYAFERYCSFKEVAENKFYESPDWYNAMASYLIQNQEGNGGWKSGACGEYVDAAYATLVLLRSTRKTLGTKKVETLESGNMRGGRGLPSDSDDVVIRNGNVVSRKDLALAKQLSELSSLTEWNLENLDSTAELSETEISELLKKQEHPIKKQLNDENLSSEERKILVQELGKSGRVENVPFLIPLLLSSDQQLAEETRTALIQLRRLTSKPTESDTNTPKNKNSGKRNMLDETPENSNSFNLKANLEQCQDQKLWDRSRMQVVDAWKEWYQTIDPNAVLE